MGKRYYCDYCDKSFADNPVNRKLHLTGVVHQRSKKAHYDAVKDERQILEDDLHKKPCRSFLSTGDCRFGERCQYSHLTNEDKARLSNKVARKERAAKEKMFEKKKTLSDLSTSLDKWLEERQCRRKEEEEEDDIEGEGQRREKEKVFVPEYQLPDCLKMFPSLPPSLLPSSKASILHAHYNGWA